MAKDTTKLKHKTIGFNNYGWEEDWKRLNPNWTEVQLSFIRSLLQDLEEETSKQSYETGYKEGIKEGIRQTDESLVKTLAYLQFRYNRE